MMLRIVPILTLAALVAATSGARVRAESLSEAMVKGGALPPELTLRCRPSAGLAQMVCNETSLFRAGPRPVEPMAIAATSFSLYTASNLATKESTAKLLRGMTGSTKIANKATPTILRLTKSVPTRYGLALAVLASGAIAVYERYGGDSGTAQAKPAESGTTYVLPSNLFRKVGEVDSNGDFREEPPGKKP